MQNCVKEKCKIFNATLHLACIKTSPYQIYDRFIAVKVKAYYYR